MDTNTVACKRCGKAIDELAVFPGGICVECHAKAFDASPQQMERTIMEVFGRGKAVRRTKRTR